MKGNRHITLWLSKYSCRACYIWVQRALPTRLPDWPSFIRSSRLVYLSEFFPLVRNIEILHFEVLRDVDKLLVSDLSELHLKLYDDG